MATVTTRRRNCRAHSRSQGRPLVAKTGNQTTVDCMPDPLLLAAAAASGAAAGPLIARLAAHRSTRQPADSCPESELVVLAHVLAAPGDYPLVAALEPADFTIMAYRFAWQEVKDTLAAAATPNRHALDGCCTGLTRTIAAPDELERHGQKVMDAALDRESFKGLLPLEPGRVGEPPLVRRYTDPSTRRKLCTSLLLAAGFCAAAILGTSAFSTPPGIIAGIIAGVVLAVAAAAWTLVDLDTLYVDLPAVWAATGVSAAFLAVACWADGSWGRLVSGTVSGLLVLGILEGTNLLHRLVRGQWGLGGGDKHVIAAAVGIPSALIGSWLTGYFILMAVGLTAVAGWAILRAADTGDRDVPFAFIPYLATGWITATFALAATGNL